MDVVGLVLVDVQCKMYEVYVGMWLATWAGAWFLGRFAELLRVELREQRVGSEHGIANDVRGRLVYWLRLHCVLYVSRS